MDNNIFTQIGLVVLIGLAAKNAILIVEFAKQLQDQGKTASEATVEACRAAAAADPDDLVRVHPRRACRWCWPRAPAPRCGMALGVAVFSGMLGVTVFGIFFTPVFYVVIRGASDRRTAAKAQATPPEAAPHPTGSG